MVCVIFFHVTPLHQNLRFNHTWNFSTQDLQWKVNNTAYSEKKTLICGWWAHPSNQTGGASFLTNINFIGSSNTSKPTNLVPLQVLQHQLKVACRARCKLPCSKAMTPRWRRLLLNRPVHHRNGLPGATWSEDWHLVAVHRFDSLDQVPGAATATVLS